MLDLLEYLYNDALEQGRRPVKIELGEHKYREFTNWINTEIIFYRFPYHKMERVTADQFEFRGAPIVLNTSIDKDELRAV